MTDLYFHTALAAVLGGVFMRSLRRGRCRERWIKKVIMLNRKGIKWKQFLEALRNALVHLFLPAKDSAYVYFLLGGITFLSIVLRLYYIDNAIGYDEAYTFIRFSSKPFKFALADYHAPNNHILNSLLIGVAYRLLGNHLWIVRVPAFIASVLSVPMAFVAVRRFFKVHQALAVAVTLAVSQTFILNAVNGRGYPLIILFSLLLANLAGLLVKEESRFVLIAYAITGALGFYTIPIFLYPMAGISLWVAVTYLTAPEPWKARWRKVGVFLLACVASGLLTLLLYSPVIIFGTGFKSLVANDIVKSQSWQSFLENFVVRSKNTWGNWTRYTSPAMNWILAVGFLISLFFYRKSSNQRLPMQVFLVIGAGVMIFLQRAVALPRIWGYLEMFYLFFSAAGLAWAVAKMLGLIWQRDISEKILNGLVLAVLLMAFANITVKTQNKETRANRAHSSAFYVAEYIATHISEKDTVVAVAPIDIQIAYYLLIEGVPYEVFYQRDYPKEIENAFILVRTKGEYNINTLEKVLDFYQLTDSLDVDAENLVFDYGPLFVYSIPSTKE